jgi:hypothetical protein
MVREILSLSPFFYYLLNKMILSLRMNRGGKMTVLIRFLFWFFIYILFLGSSSIKVEYEDGLKLYFKGWLK